MIIQGKLGITTFGIQMGGNDADVVAVDGCSTKISGCHEALETRIRRVRYMFLNKASLQPHGE